MPSLFQDNFDYLDIRRDFVHGILTSDLIGKTIHCHVVTDGYAARVKDSKSYDVIRSAALRVLIVTHAHHLYVAKIYCRGGPTPSSQMKTTRVDKYMSIAGGTRTSHRRVRLLNSRGMHLSTRAPVSNPSSTGHVK